MRTYVTTMRLAWRGDTNDPDATIARIMRDIMQVLAESEPLTGLDPIVAFSETEEHVPSWTNEAAHVRA